jgi:hypothetical protein
MGFLRIKTEHFCGVAKNYENEGRGINADKEFIDMCFTLRYQI